MKLFQKAAVGLLLSAVALLNMPAIALAQSAPEKPVTLARNGQPVMPIISGSVAEPVADLQNMLQRITGGEFRVLQNAADLTPVGNAGVIYVGLASDFPAHQFENVEQLGAEGFIIRSDGANLFLVANQPLGVQHAVTTFLQKLGARWFFPGVEWEVIPEVKTIEGAWNERQTPSFPTQRRIWYGFGSYGKTGQDMNEWNRRNRQGAPIPISIGHTWYGIDRVKDFAEHPEWFALVAGVRKTSKPCYSDPGLIAQMTRYALGAAERGAKSITLTPADGLGYCECERCRLVFQGGEPFESHGTLFAKRPDGVLVNIVSETLFNAVNQVAREVGKQYPDVQLATYSYSAYSHPASFKMEPNVYIQSTTRYQRTPLSSDELLETWGKLAGDLGVRGYWSVYQWDWDNPDPGVMRPNLVQAELQKYRRYNATALNTEASNNWAARGLGYYVGGTLLWDVNADVKELVRDFYVKAFGPAAAPMERYYARWYGPSAVVGLDDRSAAIANAPQPADLDTNPGGELEDAGQPFGSKDLAASQNSLRLSFAELDEASRLAQGNPAVQQRVDHIRMYNYYLYMRLQTFASVKTGDNQAIINAVKNETMFGGRLANTNMIHTRPLLGSAFHRRFKDQMPLIEALPEDEVKSWKKTGTPPSHDELNQLWATAKADLEGLVINQLF